MADQTTDPIRELNRRRNKRPQKMLVRALFARWGVIPMPPKPLPVKRADGTVYDGTGPRPTARDIVEQTKQD